MNTRIIALASILALTGCAKADRAPLPGDTVAADGAVALNLPHVAATPHETSGQTRTTAAELSSIEQKLYPPELVMQNQGAIELTPAQRDAIAKETDRAHKELLDLQWQLDADKEKLVAVLDGDKVDEAKTKQAAAKVIEREDAIKQGHLAMLVRVKNALTKEQQEKLRAIRDAARCGGGGAVTTPTTAPSAKPKPKNPLDKRDAAGTGDRF